MVVGMAAARALEAEAEEDEALIAEALLATGLFTTVVSCVYNYVYKQQW